MLCMSVRGAEPDSAVWADEQSHKGGRGSGGTGAASVHAPPMQCLEVHWLNALQVATRDILKHGRSLSGKKGGSRLGKWALHRPEGCRQQAVKSLPADGTEVLRTEALRC